MPTTHPSGADVAYLFSLVKNLMTKSLNCTPVGRVNDAEGSVNSTGGLGGVESPPNGVWGETPETNANLEVLSSKTPFLMSINQIKNL